jgi:hypothetical protein
VLGGREVEKLLGRARYTLKPGVWEAGRAPAPAGRAGRRYYWYRADVERFDAGR